MNLKKSTVMTVIIMLCLYILSSGPLFGSEQLETGKIIPKLVCKADNTESYALYLPSTYDCKQKYPVLVAFEPAARAVLPLELFKEAADRLNYIVLCPSNIKNGPRPPIVKAMQAVWTDINSRLTIDKTRIYATGFSGGARMASFFHLAVNNPVAGIIAVGAGLSEGLKPDQVKNAHYFGIVGYADFNYREMVRLETTLNNQGTIHRFYYYDGRHRWPPAEICTAALEWLEITALRTGHIPRDLRREFIDTTFNAEVKRIESQEKTGDIYYAAAQYQAVAKTFEGLKPIDTLLKNAQALESSKQYQKFKTDESGRLKEEEEALNKYAGVFNFVKNKPLNEIRINKLLQFAETPQWLKILKKSKNKYDRSMADRLLYNVASQSRIISDNLLQTGNLERAERFLEISANTGAHTWLYPYILYNQGAVYARLGQTKKAIKALKQSIKSGFKQLDHMKTDTDLDSLRTNKEFQQLTADPEK